MTPCETCDGTGYHSDAINAHHNSHDFCAACEAIGYVDIDPHEPCPHMPSTGGKLAWLAARYRNQVPLWNAQDARGN